MLPSVPIFGWYIFVSNLTFGGLNGWLISMKMQLNDRKIMLAYDKLHLMSIFHHYMEFLSFIYPSIINE